MSQQVTIPITTDGDGDFSVDIGPIHGLFAQFHYKPDGSAPLDTAADLDITAKTSGMTLVDIAALGTSAITRAIRVPGYSPSGTETGSSELIALAGEVLTVTVSNGGDTKSGTLWLTFV